MNIFVFHVLVGVITTNRKERPSVATGVSNMGAFLGELWVSPWG